MPARRNYPNELMELVKKKRVELISVNGESNKNGSFENIKREHRCIFKCIKCEKKHNKTVRQILEISGFYCEECTLKNAQIKIKETNIERYGVENPGQSEEVRAKMKETNMERYGVEHILQSEEVKAKMKETNMERYGVENPFQCPEVKAKMKETNIERYGVENPGQSEEVKAKIKETNIERYGVEHTLQSEEVRAKIKETNIERYGVEHPMQNAEIFHKSVKYSFKKKEYAFPSGKRVTVQGYEPQALDILIKQEYNEDDIITAQTDVPEIWYETDDGKKHRYYVDIYIKSENRMIEVKSRYTYDNKKEENHLKQQASKDAGYKHEIWILSKDGNIDETI